MQKRVARFFNDLPIARKLLLTSIIPLIALIFLSITTYRSVQTFSQDEEQLDSLYVTQKTAAQYVRLIVDLETGFRGYVLTEQVRYLRPYHIAREDIFAAGRDLEQKVSGEQQQQIKEVQSLVTQKVAEIDELVKAVGVGGKQRAYEYLEKGRGRDLMVAIRERMAHFDQLGQQRVTDKLAQLTRDRASTLFIILGGGVVTFGLIGCVMYLISRSIAVPLVNLAKVVGASPAGDAPTITVLERRDEIGDLTRVMHEMTTQIHAHLTELEKSEAALSQVNQYLSSSEAKYRGLVDHAPFGIFTTRGWDVTFSNRYNQVLAGLDPDEEVDPATFRKFIHPEDRDRVLTEFAQAVAQNQPYETVFRFLHKNGTTRKVLSRRLPLTDTAGSSSSTYIGFNIDITALDELQVKLIRAERLATLGQVAAGIAHEIRNPLVGIGSTAALLLEELPASDPRHPELAVILRETKRLDKIVNQIIDYARPRSLVPVPVALSDLVHEVLKLLDLPITNKRIGVTCDVSPELPLLYTDRDQLKQVLLNVAQNSIEAVAEAGTLNISADTLTHDQETDMVIKVRDDGCGIAADALAHVFEPFFTSGKSHGTGLGLAICRNIIEAHGGDILLTSDAGKGTLVQIVLPLRQESRLQRYQT